jgi:hypothetical protein
MGVCAVLLFLKSVVKDCGEKIASIYGFIPPLFGFIPLNV